MNQTPKTESPQRLIWAIWSKDTSTHRSYQLRGNNREEGTLWVPKDVPNDPQVLESITLVFVEAENPEWKKLNRLYDVLDRAGNGPQPKDPRPKKEVKKQWPLK